MLPTDDEASELQIVDDDTEVEDNEMADIYCQDSNASKWTPAQLKQPVNKKLSVRQARQKHSLQDEKILLTKAQKTFFEMENKRAEEKHLKEMEKLELQNELLRL